VADRETRALPLGAQGVTVQFGGLTAVDDASITVEPGKIVGLIGPNGAGKTTLFECISGFQVPNAGSIRYGDVELVGMPPWDRPRVGIARTLQNVRLFPELSVLDNLRIAHHLTVDSDAIGDAVGATRSRRSEEEILARADHLIDLVGLRYFRDKNAGELSYGTLRMLEIACVLALDPTLLLLDEPSSGISQKETEALGPVLKRIAEVTGCSILIIEHDMPLVMSLADEIYAMEAGAVVAHGTPDEIRTNQRVIEGYLGTLDGSEPATPKRPVDIDLTHAEPMLEVRGLEVHYGKVQVLYEVDVDIYEGEVTALLGTNGAGKSTVLKAVTGLLKPSRGTIRYEGRDITKTSPEDTVRLGIAQVPGGRGVFPTLSVEENMTLGGFSRGRRDKAVAASLERVYEYFPRLYERRRQAAGTLSGGEQQMLAIGRSLLSQPRLLMIDEMSLGLAPIVVQQLVEIIDRLHRQEDITIVVVEQHATFALSFTDRAYFLEKGEVRFAGPSHELADRDDLLRSVFLAGAAEGLGAATS
jgi:branched-chain amino acid transport system ATP-binding protein